MTKGTESMTRKISSPVNIIAVENVEATSELLSNIFGWKSVHGGAEFDILMSKDNIPAILLHDYDHHDHKRFRDVSHKQKGVGQSLYVFVDAIEVVYERIQKLKLAIVEPLFLNENSKAREFTFRISEGYQFSVCETNEWLFYAL